MLLAVRIKSYGCTWEIWRALKKLELLEAQPRATLTLLSIGNPGSLCVTRDITQVNYREHMRRSLGLKICWKMEIIIDKTYHVANFCCP